MLGLSDDQNSVNIRLKAVKAPNGYMSCKGCYFDDKEGGCYNNKCTPAERKDKRNIIWKEVK